MGEVGLNDVKAGVEAEVLQSAAAGNNLHQIVVILRAGTVYVMLAKRADRVSGVCRIFRHKIVAVAAVIVRVFRQTARDVLQLFFVQFNKRHIHSPFLF